MGVGVCVHGRMGESIIGGFIYLFGLEGLIEETALGSLLHLLFFVDRSTELAAA